MSDQARKQLALWIMIGTFVPIMIYVRANETSLFGGDWSRLAVFAVAWIAGLLGLRLLLWRLLVRRGAADRRAPGLVTGDPTTPASTVRGDSEAAPVEGLRLRQAGRRDPGKILGLGVAAMAWAFAGFWVYGSVTGKTTVGDDVPNALGLVWFGPLLAWFIAFLVGPRGWLAPLWHPAAVVTLDHEGISWDVDGVAGRAEWPKVATVKAWPSGRGAMDAEILDQTRTPLAYLPRELTGPDGRDYLLGDLVLSVRPDLFQRAKDRVVRITDA